MRRHEIVAKLIESSGPRYAPTQRQRFTCSPPTPANEARPDSDPDVFIDKEGSDKEGSRKLGFDVFMGVYLMVQERLGRNVDYGTREGRHSVLRPDIERETVRVF